MEIKILKLIQSLLFSYSITLLNATPLLNKEFLELIQAHNYEDLITHSQNRTLGPTPDSCDLLSFLNSNDLQKELEILKNEKFIAVSLGENCFPAAHIMDHQIRIRSFPFDWNITSFDSLYAIIENDFDGFLDLKNLSINDYTVLNSKYNCKLMHDFDKADWTNGPQGLTPISDIAMEDYHRIVSYYQRRIARFYAIFNLNVPIYLFRRVITSAQAARLCMLLKNKFPKSNFKLVCIEEGSFEPEKNWLIPNVIRFTMRKAEEPLYHVGHYNPVWHRMLTQLGLLK